jgi:hypothetical protein
MSRWLITEAKTSMNFGIYDFQASVSAIENAAVAALAS